MHLFLLKLKILVDIGINLWYNKENEKGGDIVKDAMIYKPVKVCTEENICETWLDVCRTNEKRIREIEKKAIANGGLLHRFLYESVADGRGVYQIVKETDKYVQVRFCSLDGFQDYVVPQWGMEAIISKAYAQDSINRQDAWNKIIV